MTMILPALGAGACAGAFLMLFSHLAPYVGVRSAVKDIDRPRLFGTVVTRREAHLAGMLLHLVISTVWGGGYALLADLGIVDGFGFLPVLVWGTGILTLVMGGIVFPLEGHGLFGIKEDAWFPIDLLVTNVFWSILFWWLLRVWLGLAIS